MEVQIEKAVEVDRLDFAMNLFGNCDENIKIIEGAFGIRIISRDNGIKIVGPADQAEKAEKIVEYLISIAGKGETIIRQNVNYIIQLEKDGQLDTRYEDLSETICITARGKHVKPKTYGQKAYVKAIKENVIVFGIGPAGTGKTYLAVAMAVTAFRNREVNRIILTRPAVEAGEKLGFLPGDLQNKVDPYLRPLYDALYEILGLENYQKHIEKGIIEIAPLAYMRGRTLDDSFIILDEAQNTTPEQMKMFLTRIGFGSKAIITGDITQIDLPGDKKSGLKEVIKILNNIKGIEFVFLTERDVVRHELVQKIIKAYEEHDNKENNNKENNNK